MPKPIKFREKWDTIMEHILQREKSNGSPYFNGLPKASIGWFLLSSLSNFLTEGIKFNGKIQAFFNNDLKDSNVLCQRH